MGKGSKPIIGFHYRPAFHHGLTTGPIDAFLEMRAGDRTAWQGVLSASGTISINAPHLFGGEKDQGGIVGAVDVMFGEPTQPPNAYLLSTFGSQVPAWRGFTTVVFKGGRYGAMNPYPQKASYKIRRILQGWDGGVAWNPDRAQITVGAQAILPNSVWAYKNVGAGDATDYSQADTTDWSLGQAPFGNGDYSTQSKLPSDHGFSNVPTTTVSVDAAIWYRKDFYFDGTSDVSFECFVDDTFVLYVNGVEVHVQDSPLSWGYSVVTIPQANIVAGMNKLAIRQTDTNTDLADSYFDCRFTALITGVYGINPAHVLYDSRTNGDMGRESTSSINEASLSAAADKLYAEGFGICPKWDPASESVEDFETRICRLIGGSFTRSLEDGQWYLDLARGDYVLEDLPILSDDDILDFKEQPSTLDSAVNSVSVRYFDPERKETIVTPPVRALGLVAAFGTIHQTLDFPEIPTGSLATRVALRELLAFTTPTRAFDLVTTRRTYAWRPNQYFRLQATRRGIADMVCLVGQKQSGTLKSGAIRMKATQDIYSLPVASFVEVEPGVDTSPDQTPTVITLQRAEEAPYIEVVAALSRADLEALPDDAGFLMAVAATSTTDLDFSLLVDPDGAGFEEVGRGEWCASATVVEDAVGPVITDLTLADGFRLDQVELGTPVLWDDELCRVDAIDAVAGTVTLGRGCGDTVPTASHAAGSRLWFYQTGFAYDTTEYTDGESIDVKLLSNTGSQQLAEAAATVMPVTFDQRQARPYPPGKLLFSGALFTDAAYPAQLIGALTTKWAHRDRVLQADQLVDTSDASIGPEAGTTYTVTYEQPPGSVVNTESGIIGTAATPYTFPAAGTARISVVAVRGGLESWQSLSHSFDYEPTLPDTRITEAGDIRITEAGDTRVTE